MAWIIVVVLVVIIVLGSRPKVFCQPERTSAHAAPDIQDSGSLFDSRFFNEKSNQILLRFCFGLSTGNVITVMNMLTIYLIIVRGTKVIKSLDFFPY